jgi:hypothetical protein
LLLIEALLVDIDDRAGIAGELISMFESVGVVSAIKELLDWIEFGAVDTIGLSIDIIVVSSEVFLFRASNCALKYSR